MSEEICEVRNCRNSVGITYSATRSGNRRGVCFQHWGRHSEMKKLRPLKNDHVYKKN